VQYKKVNPFSNVSYALKRVSKPVKKNKKKALMKKGKRRGQLRKVSVTVANGTAVSGGVSTTLVRMDRGREYRAVTRCARRRVEQPLRKGKEKKRHRVIDQGKPRGGKNKDGASEAASHGEEDNK